MDAHRARRVRGAVPGHARRRRSRRAARRAIEAASTVGDPAATLRTLAMLGRRRRRPDHRRRRRRDAVRRDARGGSARGRELPPPAARRDDRRRSPRRARRRGVGPHAVRRSTCGGPTPRSRATRATSSRPPAVDEPTLASPCRRSSRSTPLSRDDIDDVLAIDEASFTNPWTRAMYLCGAREPGVSSCFWSRDDEPPGGRLLLVLARARRAAHQQPGGAARAAARAASRSTLLDVRPGEGGASWAPAARRSRSGGRTSRRGGCTSGSASRSPGCAPATTRSRSRTRWCCGGVARLVRPLDRTRIPNRPVDRGEPVSRHADRVSHVPRRVPIDQWPRDAGSTRRRA